MCAAPVRRKLAAILAADAVGYSRLMAADEEGTMRILSAHRTVDGIIEFHEGRIVGTAARLTRRDLMRRDGRQERVTER